jgi:hypothetical protein
MIKTDSGVGKVAQRLCSRLLLSGSLILLCFFYASAQDNLVVPGKRVGSVRLGNTRLFAWPMLIVEASETGNKQSVLRNPQEFDEAFKRTPEAAVKRGKSEFFGTTLSAFQVKMLNANLASISYECQLPKGIVAANPATRRDRFNALTVLQRDPDRGNKWKIVLVTVPK